MVRMLILRNTVADGGRAFEAGDIAELSKKDADILRVRGKAEAFDEEAAQEFTTETETATAELSGNAMRKSPKRRKAARGR